jgi:Plavaka transposase
MIKVIEQLGLLYYTVKELNEMIDNEMPGHPSFQCKEVTFNDECLEFYHRDIIQCIQAIYSDAQFAPDLVFAPEWHFTSHECIFCIYNEMHTANWW